VLCDSLTIILIALNRYASIDYNLCPLRDYLLGTKAALLQKEPKVLYLEDKKKKEKKNETLLEWANIYI